MRDETVILIAKITHSCNLKCEYCFYTKSLNGPSPQVLPIEDLKTILFRAAGNWRRISLVLHGGEPLLLPLSYFEELLDYEKQLSVNHGTVFRNSIQTNGTVFTAQICDFVKQRDIYLGASLDGSRETHNRNRPFKNNNRGSFDTVIENIRSYKASGLRLSALVVATKPVVGDPETLYAFFKSEGIDLKINELHVAKTPQHLIPTPDELAEFYEKMFDLWFNDTQEPILRIRPFTTMIAGFWGSEVGDCTFRSNCSSFLVLETDGSVFSCARFSNAPGFRLGNILCQSWDEILKAPIISQLNNRKEKLPDDCQACDWLAQCWGGCAACALEGTGDLFGKTIWCEARRHILGYIKDKLETINREDVRYGNTEEETEAVSQTTRG